MLPVIIFWLCLLFSITIFLDWAKYLAHKQRGMDANIAMLFILITITLWSYLFYLLH
jgi:hypothetical protein